MTERLGRRALGALVALSVLLGAASSAVAQNIPLERGDFAGSVGIGGGRSLYLECHGRGSPTVILEAGLRSRSDFWSERPEETRGTTALPGIARGAWPASPLKPAGGSPRAARTTSCSASPA